MISKENKRFNITINKDLYLLLKKISKDNNITISNFISITIIDFLDKRNKEYLKNKGENKNEQ